MSRNKWPDMIIELQSLSQAGLTYGRDDFDLERYARIRNIAAEVDIVIAVARPEKAQHSPLRIRCLQDLHPLPRHRRKLRETGFDWFAEDDLPPLDVAKNSEEQVRMCFEAYRAGDEWKVRFD